MYFVQRHNEQESETSMSLPANQQRQQQRKQQHQRQQPNKYRDYYAAKKGKFMNKAPAQRFQQQQKQQQQQQLQKQQGNLRNTNSYRSRLQQDTLHNHNEEYLPPFPAPLLP